MQNKQSEVMKRKWIKSRFFFNDDVLAQDVLAHKDRRMKLRLQYLRI